MTIVDVPTPEPKFQFQVSTELTAKCEPHLSECSQSKVYCQATQLHMLQTIRKAIKHLKQDGNLSLSAVLLQSIRSHINL